MVKLVDTQRSERCGGNLVEVQILSPAHSPPSSGGMGDGEVTKLLWSREDLKGAVMFFQQKKQTSRGREIL